MTNLDSILRSRDIPLPTKVYLVKAMVFPVVMYGWESETIKKAENWRIDAFELWCWRRLLRVSWTARRSNQSILKEISPEYSLEGLMLKAETPILWPSDVKNRLIGKDPDGGKDWRQEEKGMTEDEMVGWHHQRNGHEFEWTPGVGDGQGGLVCCSSWGHKESDMTEWLNWTELKCIWNFNKIDSSSVRALQFSSVTQSCPTLCNPMNCSMPGLPVHHQVPESTQTHVLWVSDVIPTISSPSSPALNISQHQGLFKWGSSLHQVAKVLEFQLQHQTYQWTPRTDLL